MNEEQTPQTQNHILTHTCEWKKHLFTVTPFSKYLALALFVTLPFGGFLLGVGVGLHIQRLDGINQGVMHKVNVEETKLSYASIFSVQGMAEKIVINEDHTWMYDNDLPSLDAKKISSTGVLTKKEYDTFAHTIRESGLMNMIIEQKGDGGMVCDSSISWEIQIGKEKKDFRTPCVDELNSKTQFTLDILENANDVAKELIFSKQGNMNEKFLNTYISEEFSLLFKYPNTFVEQSNTDAGAQMVANDGKGMTQITVQGTGGVHKDFPDLSGELVTADGAQGYLYYYREGAGYSGVLLLKTEAGMLSLSYDAIGTDKSESEIQKEFQEIIATIDL